MRGARPVEDAWEEFVDTFHFGVTVFVEALVVGVVGLVPEIPGEDAGVVGEGGDDADDVVAELRLDGGVEKTSVAGALHPAGIVDAGDGRMLWAEVRVRLPAGVEENEDGADVMARGDGEEGVEAMVEAVWVTGPELVLEEDAHGVHADGFSEAEFAVVDRGVECGGLKHFELVDGIGGNVVGADEPGLLRIPGVGLGFSPALR